MESVLTVERIMREVNAKPLDLDIPEDTNGMPKRGTKAEALRRYEDAARSLDDFKDVIATWNKLDQTRERPREKSHGFFPRRRRKRKQRVSGWRILSTALKRLAGFGKNGEKTFPGIVTQLQMETYLVISEFRHRENRRGKAYGMPVSILLPPESICGYDMVTAAYSEYCPFPPWHGP